jgi:hypothetical protein
MDQSSFKDIAKNMRRTGMLLFRAAFMEALNGGSIMCVVHAAHAAEILLKARIAQEHPLLIFSKLPKSDSSKDSLTLIDLLESGRTLSYEELPDQLWATTGIKIERIKQYREFGRLRNQIIHLSTSNSGNLDVLTVLYSLELLDPLVEGFWGKSVIYFIKEDPLYSEDALVSSGFFEDGIRRFMPIDERLRRLLGNDSKEAWEYIITRKKEMNDFNNSKSNEDWDSEAANWLDSDEHDDGPYTHLQEDQEKWNIFLESF